MKVFWACLAVIVLVWLFIFLAASGLIPGIEPEDPDGPLSPQELCEEFSPDELDYQCENLGSLPALRG